MLDESYVLVYNAEVLEDMSDEKRHIFGEMHRFVISTTELRDTQTICFHFYQDHFLAVIAKWPWLLCSNLGAHLERHSYDEEFLPQKFYGGVWRP